EPLVPESLVSRSPGKWHQAHGGKILVHLSNRASIVRPGTAREPIVADASPGARRWQIAGGIFGFSTAGFCSRICPKRIARSQFIPGGYHQRLVHPFISV